MKPSSSVFDGVLARGGVAEQVSGRAWLQALLDFEVALARAQARAGIITAEDAQEIAAVCDVERFDVAEIGAGAAEIGNPAGAVVKALKQATDAPVHHGATSQDAVDTAMMLVVKRALVPLLGDLRGAANAAAALAQEHRGTPIMGRTLLQEAKPTTFGLKAAGWMVSARRGRRPSPQRAARLPVGRARRDARTAQARPRPRRAADPLAHLARPRRGTRGRPRRGVRRTRQGRTRRHADGEVREVRERVGGGSTAMPHKHNPVAAISALGCTRQAPGLVATLLAAMEQELERAAGAWHSEWAPLNQLLIATGSAASWLRACLETLEVHPTLADADTGAAALLVDRALEAR